MKKLSIFATAALLGAISLSAQADNSWSLQYSMYDIDGGAAGKASPKAVEASYEMGFANNMSVEAYIGVGAGSDKDVKVKTTYGLEGKYSYSFNDNFAAQAQVGYSSYKFDVGSDISDSNFGYGVGATYKAGPGAILVQYRDLGQLDDAGFKADITSIDVGYKMPL